MSLSPSERIQRARIGAFTMHARHDVTKTTAAGRHAADQRFFKEVDPDGVLPLPERERRAAALRKAHMTRLAFLSAKARRR